MAGLWGRMVAKCVCENLISVRKGTWDIAGTNSGTRGIVDTTEYRPSYIIREIQA